MSKRSKTSRRRRKPAAPDVASQFLGAQRKLLSAGLSAISRGSKSVAPMGTTAIAESLQGGLKKLEEVFDHRVLNSLASAGMPSPAELCKLIERVEALAADVERLKRKQGKR